MDDTGVLLRDGRDADGPALIPSVRQRLGERRIDFELRRHYRAVRLRGRGFLERALGEPERGEQCEKRRTDQEVTLALHTISPRCHSLEGFTHSRAWFTPSVTRGLQSLRARH